MNKTHKKRLKAFKEKQQLQQHEKEVAGILNAKTAYEPKYTVNDNMVKQIINVLDLYPKQDVIAAVVNTSTLHETVAACKSMNDNTLNRLQLSIKTEQNRRNGKGIVT